MPETCPAALNLVGEHHPCDLTAPHPGLTHSSRTAQAIWTDDPAALQAAWASAQEAGR